MGEGNKTKKPTVADFNKLKSDFEDLAKRTDKLVEVGKKYESAVKNGFIREQEDGTLTTSPQYKRGESSEQKALRDFGIRDVRDVLKINIGHERFKRVPEYHKFLVLDLKNTITEARWISQMFHGQPLDLLRGDPDKDSIANVKGMLETPYGRDVLAPKLKAFTTTTAADWIPTAVADQFVPEFE